MAALHGEEASGFNASTNPKRILIVDDSDIILQRLSSLISDMIGLKLVGIAKNAHDAIHQHQKLNPDIVILDLRMPGGGGISVLKEIKENSPETVVAILTNYPYIAYRKCCAELGADFFFDKSTEFEKVKSIF